ncbi:DUF885 domain-containing protein [Shewanella marina]|uniref:DUF885 domain-containing protein n=1 Tax=Shewanella marina TaxID=487319 RepID=UPI00055C1B15|nr:DUF885 domain-containing protein [Shewanella marina]
MLIIILLSGCQLTETQSTLNDEQVALAKIIELDWEIKLHHNPRTTPSKLLKKNNYQLKNMSPVALEDEYQQKKMLLQQLQKINTKQLNDQDKINYEILIYQLKNSIDLYRYNAHYQPINSEGGFYSYLANAADKSFKSEQDYQNYLTYLSSIPRYFKQQQYWLKQGLKSKNTPPQAVLIGIDNSIAAFIKPYQQSEFYQPFTHFSNNISQQQRQKLSQQAKQIISTQINPAYQQLFVFMRDNYIPNARTTIAANELPNGIAFYQNRVKHYTTLALSTDEIHQLGLAEVKRIKNEMHQIINDLKFEGTFADFLQFLRTSPQFYAQTPDELLKQAAYISKQADAALPKLFGKLPRTPYGVSPVPAQIAPKYTTGRYSGSNDDSQPGYYWVNTYALNKRPLYVLEALTLHEAVPGHHLQISLTKELTSLPNFRRYSYISAFGEGWGLYSEYLGIEAGFYQNPYSNFGRLTYEMWRAIRLVVDTGVHTKGWSRQQAIDYMAQNTALSMHNVTTEVDRYISWPAQALSYKIGELTIKRLRNKAEQQLQDKFDIREFHDAILANGSVPLPILEQQINQYIKQKIQSQS